MIAEPNTNAHEINSLAPSFMQKSAHFAKKVGQVALKTVAAIGITAGCVVGYGVIGAVCGAIVFPAFIVVAAVVGFVAGFVFLLRGLFEDPQSLSKMPKPVTNPKPTTAEPKLWLATKAFLLKSAKCGAYVGGFFGALVGLKVGAELSWNILVKNNKVTSLENKNFIVNGLVAIGIASGILIAGPGIALGSNVKIGSPNPKGFTNGIIPEIKINSTT